MARLVVDTNVFLRFLLKDIPNQLEESEKLFKKAKQGKVDLTIPQVVIFEIVYALEKYYHFPKDQIIDMMESMVAVNYFNVQDRQIFIQTFKLFRSCHLGITDCFLISFAQEQRMDIYSFDKDLNKIAQKIA